LRREEEEEALREGLAGVKPRGRKEVRRTRARYFSRTATVVTRVVIVVVVVLYQVE
jgi:hypothetical protein